MDLSRLMKENVIEIDLVTFEPSPRLTNEDGTPQVWQIKPLSQKEVRALTEKYTTQKISAQGVPITKFNDEAFSEDLIFSCLVEPSKEVFEQGELMDSWGAKRPYEVLEKMLLPGELRDLDNAIQKACGYDKNYTANLVKEIKKN